jgi:hypothetical protein
MTIGPETRPFLVNEHNRKYGQIRKANHDLCKTPHEKEDSMPQLCMKKGLDNSGQVSNYGQETWQRLNLSCKIFPKCYYHDTQTLQKIYI